MGGGPRGSPPARGLSVDGDDGGRPLSGVEPAGWYPDPTGQHQHRWFDGAAWTDRAADGGQEVHSPLTASAWPVESVQQTALYAGAVGTFPGESHLFGEPIVVVDPWENLFSWGGLRLGGVRPGPAFADLEARLVPTPADRIVQRLEVADPTGAPQLRIVVARGPGGPVGADHTRALVHDAAGTELAWIQDEGPDRDRRRSLWIGGADAARIQPADATGETFVIAELGRSDLGWFRLVPTGGGARNAVVIQAHLRLAYPWDRLLLAAALVVDRSPRVVA